MGMNGTPGEVSLRAYDEADWEVLRPFILRQWGPGHPMADRRLFDWQFRGFGPRETRPRSILLFLEGRLAGFRGIIPGLYQVPSPEGMRVLPGGSLAMWMIAENLRGKGLGRMMHEAAERSCRVLSGAGSNPLTSVPVYLKSGFHYLEAMNRYLAVLDREKSEVLFGSGVSGIPSPSSGNRAKPLSPSPADPRELAAAWAAGAYEAGFFSLYRNEDFWKWRILESRGFRYGVFVDPSGSGFAVARIESPPGVLRVIDLVPSGKGAWQGVLDAGFSSFLAGCLAWAREAGCIAADFHCSSGVFRPILEKSGFYREEDCSGSGIPALPRLFNGKNRDARPINALAKAPFPVSFEKSYMVKSDNDMDRPRRLDADGNVLY